jgi:hypothetical protein
MNKFSKDVKLDQGKTISHKVRMKQASGQVNEMQRQAISMSEKAIVPQIPEKTQYTGDHNNIEHSASKTYLPQGSESRGLPTSLATRTETARDQLLLIFAEDEVLRVLYAAALQQRKLSSRRLENNLRRLIRKFCMELQPGAQSPMNIRALKLVRSQRRWIARQIGEQFSPLNAIQMESMLESRKQVANTRPIPQDYLATARSQAVIDETSDHIINPGVISDIDDKSVQVQIMTPGPDAILFSDPTLLEKSGKLHDLKIGQHVPLPQVKSRDQPLV